MLWIKEVEMKIQQTHDNRELTISELSQLKMLVVIKSSFVSIRNCPENPINC